MKKSGQSIPKVFQQRRLRPNSREQDSNLALSGKDWTFILKCRWIQKVNFYVGVVVQLPLYFLFQISKGLLFCFFAKVENRSGN